MHQLIQRVREKIPLDRPLTEICSDDCNGCSLKLLEYLSTELDGWEQQLAEGRQPNFGDLRQLERSSRKIYAALCRNGLIEE